MEQEVPEESRKGLQGGRWEGIKKQLEQFTWQTKWSYDNQMSVNSWPGTEWRPGANKVIS